MIFIAGMVVGFFLIATLGFLGAAIIIAFVVFLNIALLMDKDDDKRNTLQL